MFVQGEYGLGLVVGVGAKLVEEEGERVLVVGYQEAEGGVRGLEVGDCGLRGGELGVEI